jgi:probable HAF family extracellular repeat protein
MRLSLAVLCGLCVVPLIPGVAVAQSTYTYRTIAVPDATLTLAFGINDRSQIVGGFNGQDDRAHGFLLSNGEFTVIDVPGALATNARGINNKGQIVGEYHTDNNIIRGFLFEQGRFTTIAPPGSGYTIAYDINDAGQIVGVFGSFADSHAFLWTHGQFVAPDPANLAVAQASGINRSGQLVMVSFAKQTGLRLEPGGAWSEIRVAGAAFTSPTGINDRGEIVGWWRSATDTNLRGFVLAFGLLTPVNVPGHSVTQPQDINNRGQIVGATSGGAFLATPAGMVEEVSDSPSPSGTRIPVASFIVDGDLATWTLGPGQEILRDGAPAGNGYGSEVLWHQGTIYVLGDDYNWWRWADGIWIFVGPSDPSR